MLAALRATIGSNKHLCVIAMLALAAALVPVFAERRDADDWTTIAYVQEFILEDGNVRDPFFGTDNTVDPRYLISAWPRVLAGLSSLSGVGPVVMVREVLPPVLTALAVLIAFAFFAGIKPRDKWVPAIATALFVLYFATTAANSTERQGEAFFLRLAQDKFFVAFILVPLSAMLLMRAVNGGSLVTAAAATIVAVVAANIHPFAPVLLALLVVPIAVGRAFDREASGKVANCSIILLVVAVSAIPAAMHYWLADSTQTSAMFTASELQAPSPETMSAEELQVATLAGMRYDRLPFGLAVANRSFVVHGMAVLAGAFLPLVALSWRRELAARYSIVLFSMVIALLYLPPLMRAEISILTAFQAWRVSFVLPYAVALVTAVGAAELRHRLRSLGWGRVAWALPLTLVTASVVPGLVFSMRWQMESGSESLYLAPSASEIRLIKSLDESGDSRLVVLASRLTSRFVPSYAPRARVVDFRDAALAFPPGEQWNWHQRRTDVVSFFEQTEVDDAVVEILRRYGVGVVIVDKSAPVHEAIQACPRLFRVEGESVEQALYYVVKPFLAGGPAECSVEAAPGANPTSYVVPVPDAPNADASRQR